MRSDIAAYAETFYRLNTRKISGPAKAKNGYLMTTDHDDVPRGAIVCDVCGSRAFVAVPLNTSSRVECVDCGSSFYVHPSLAETPLGSPADDEDGIEPAPVL